ncbi:MAG: hypothetical protein ACYC4R_15675 [Anaerolineae bacterium]
MKLFLRVALLALLSIPWVGCASQQTLHDVSIRPAVISPNADGTDDIAEITYSLRRQSTISMYFVGEDGARHDYRVDKRRSKGDRTAYFGGVIDGTLLPDGAYTCVIEAVDDRGRNSRSELPITIVDGDKTPLTIDNLTVFPETFTPNRDGISDRVTIGYNLSKPVTLVQVYVVGADGAIYPVDEDEIREMGAAGTHEHDYDAGIDLGATPPPDGTYTVVVEATDAVGNQSQAESSLTIEGGGVPRVEIVNRAAKIEPSVVALGATLTFTCTVKNVGTVPVRTKGPEPDMTYTTAENYNTIAQYEEPGLFRIGLDFEGNSSGRSYPYRWQLGSDEELTVIDTPIGEQKYLMPGQTVEVVGHLTIADKPNMIEPYFWLGLIHEQVEIVQDQVGATPISIGF